MPVSLAIQDDRATVDEMPWDEHDSTDDQTSESTGQVFPKPRVKSNEGSFSGAPEDAQVERDEGASAGATEHIQKDLCGDINPLVRHTRAPHRLFEVLQQWEGIVSEVTEDSVWADLVDLTDRTRAEEIVELPLAEIPEADRSILRPGSVFYWAIGREWSRGGQMRRVSEIRVRRTPQWSQHSVDLLKVKAMALMDRFDGNVENTTATGQ